MGEKDRSKSLGKKIGFGVLFVASCFIAMYILMGFYEELVLVGIAAVLLLISAFLFLNAMFADKTQEWSKLPEEGEQKATPSAAGAGSGDGEFRLKITKHMKDMESTQKEMLDVLKKQNVILQTQIENLENEIYMLSEKQIKQTKILIKYNKENARQLAISERETLEHVLMEVKQAIEDNAVVVPMVAAEAEAAPAMEEFYAEPSEMTMAEELEVVMPEEAAMEEVPESELFAVPELPADDEYEEPNIGELLASMSDGESADVESLDEVPEIADIPGLDEMPEIADIPGLDEMPEIADIPGLDEMLEIADIPGRDEMPEIADIPGLDEMPEMPADLIIPEPVAEEIAVADEPVKEPEPAPAPVASNPNAMMTPEEIAKLLESMGQ